MDKVVEKILILANLAPSGENAQPWNFVYKDGVVDIFNLPSRDQSIYNYKSLASNVAHGALLENLSIAARHYGMKASIELFPSKDDNHVATVNFEQDDKEIKDDDLFQAIEKRVSNRKPYKKIKLTDSEVASLKESIIFKGVHLKLFDSNSEMKKLAEAGGGNEEVMLQNKFLHNFFFSHINWTKEEDHKKKVGFYIKTLELPAPIEFMFKIIKNWEVVKFFNKIGFAKMVGKQNAKLYAEAAAIGVIAIDNENRESYVNAGRALERIWLTATAYNLSMQPLTGLLFMHLRIRNGDSDKFSKKEVDLIKYHYDQVKKCFSEDKNMVMMFRIGKSSTPTAQAVRFDINDVVKYV